MPCKILLNLAFAASVALAAQALPVRADGPPCAARDVVLTALTERFDEHRRSIGIGANGMVVEIYASAAGGWSIVVTRPDGLSCIVASGQAFEAFDETPPVGDPA